LNTTSWIALVGLAAIAALGLALRAWRRPRVRPLPAVWAVSPRPVFSTIERRVFKLLKESLPQHIVLAKLPLVRFCQPSEPDEVRYWFDLLGVINVTFAICAQNGRVLAAIDLEHDRSSSRRTLQIKQSVLGACRVRYLRCPIDNLPTPRELQALVPQSGAAPSRFGDSVPREALGLHAASESLSHTVASRRAQRERRWHDSTHFNDSCFAPDSRFDADSSSEFGERREFPDATLAPSSLGGPNRGDEAIAAVVVDEPGRTPPGSR
jgi:hypothetical protein